MRTGKSHYCEIIVRTDGCENAPATFYRGQGSSYRVAARNAIEDLVQNGAGFWENVSIRTGRVK